MPVLSAHTGQNFFLVEDASVTAPGVVQVGSQFEWTHADRMDTFGIEPSAMVRLVPGLALGLQSSFAHEGSGWQFQSVLPALQFSPDLSGWKLPFQVMFSAGYQVTDAAAGHSHVHVHTPPPGPPIDLGPDAPPPDPSGGSTSHVHGGSGTSVIHLHGTDALMSRLALETSLPTRTQLAWNLIAVQPDGENLSFATALGLRQPLTPEWSVGAEYSGDIGANGQRLLLGTVGWQPNHHLSLRLGVGGGLTPSSPDVTVRSAVAWVF